MFSKYHNFASLNVTTRKLKRHSSLYVLFVCVCGSVCVYVVYAHMGVYIRCLSQPFSTTGFETLLTLELTY